MFIKISYTTVQSSCEIIIYRLLPIDGYLSIAVIRLMNLTWLVLTLHHGMKQFSKIYYFLFIVDKTFITTFHGRANAFTDRPRLLIFHRYEYIHYIMYIITSLDHVVCVHLYGILYARMVITKIRFYNFSLCVSFWSWE